MSEAVSASAIKYRLGPNDLSTLERLFDKSDVGDYFQAISKSSITNQMLSSHYANDILSSLEKQLNQGKLDVAEEP